MCQIFINKQMYENSNVLIEYESDNRVFLDYFDNFSISDDCLNVKRNSLNPIKLEKEVIFIHSKSLLGL